MFLACLIFGTSKHKDMTTKHTPEQLEQIRNAAPELLEAIIAHLTAEAEGNNTKARIAKKMMKAAIAKATGTNQ